MLPRSVNAVEERSAGRTTRLVSYRIGTTFTIHHARILTRSIRIVKKKSKRLESGRIDSMHTESPKDVVKAKIPAVTMASQFAVIVGRYAYLTVESRKLIIVDPNTSHGLFFAPPADFENTTSTVQVLDDATGGDAYLRRLKLSDTHQKSALDSAQHEAEPTRPHPVGFQPIAQSSSDPPIRRNMQSTAPSISRAPVRYNLPPPPPEIPSTEAELADALGNEDAEPDESKNGEAPRSLRPGQQGFAERLMSKYGWTKGSGLGASGSGIVNPLRVQVEKQKKKPDAEGGGFVGPGGRGRIIGGKKGASDSEAKKGPFGSMSEVIVLHGMIDGLDLDAELERADDGGLLQEIGEECGEKVRTIIALSIELPRWSNILQYGRVERVFIDRNDPNSPRVFVNFTSQLSALRVIFLTSRSSSVVNQSTD